MSIPYKKLHIPSSKFKLKSPFSMIPEGICVHNTANDAPAINEANYCRNNNNATSYHIAVDEKEAIELLPLNRMAFHAGDGLNGKGNRKYIGIEICYSKSGGTRYNQAESNAIKLIAKMLHECGWSIDRVKKHQDFSGKYCPHRILDKDNGWKDFLNRIQLELDKLKGNIGDDMFIKDGTSSTLRNSFIDKLEVANKAGKIDAKWVKQAKDGSLNVVDMILLQEYIK